MPQDGYWQSAANSTELHACPRRGACKCAPVCRSYLEKRPERTDRSMGNAPIPVQTKMTVSTSTAPIWTLQTQHSPSLSGIRPHIECSDLSTDHAGTKTAARCWAPAKPNGTT